MLPPSEQDMEVLSRDLDALEEEFKNAKAEAESLRTLLAVEAQNRQSAEALCLTLEGEKARLVKFQEEFLAQTVQQLDFRSKYDGLWQEMNLRTEQDVAKEKEYEKTVWNLKEKLQFLEQESGARICFLESQLHSKELCVARLEEEIAQLHEDLDILAQTYQQTRQSDQAEFRREIAKLSSELCDAREANEKLETQLQKQQQSSMLEKTKLEAQIQELGSNWHLGALKQKLMKLRKENEELKRQRR